MNYFISCLIKIVNNFQFFKSILSAYGGPDGEMSASMRYLSQRYSMPDKKVKAALTDIGISVSILLLLFFDEACFNNFCLKML